MCASSMLMAPGDERECREVRKTCHRCHATAHSLRVGPSLRPQMHTEEPSPVAPDSSTPVEAPPKNGRAGLRHWRHDLLAGLVVSFVSLPLSSGIAIASGAPPIYGIISSIIAGLIFPFVGGSFVTISGPAAGLAPALLVTMAALGGAGDADHVGAGYAMLLVVICMVGVAQVVMSKLGLARFAAVFPASVVEGMLGAIGILILVKALPLALGILEPVHAHGFVEYVREIPHWVAAADTRSVIIATVCLVIFGVLGTSIVRKVALFRTVPAHVFAVAAGVAMAAAFGMGSEFLIAVPANPLSGIQLPDFRGLATSPNLWKAAAIGFFTLTLIDGVESLATAQAIDRIDPFKRKSTPDKVLRAMGISNVGSSLLGGLTVIPGGVKSKTCIEAGGRTLWANFANAMFLLCFLFIAPGIVSLIPKSALGAVLVYTGWKMAHPRIAAHLRSVGNEQFGLYVATVAVTLMTDLLVGVLAGTALKYLYVVGKGTSGSGSRGLTKRLVEPWRDPVTSSEVTDGTHVLEVGRPLVCFNAYRLMERLDSRSGEHPTVIRLAGGATIVDHTAAEALLTSAEEGNGSTIRVEGVDSLSPVSPHQHAVRLRSDLRGSR